MRENLEKINVFLVLRGNYSGENYNGGSWGVSTSNISFKAMQKFQFYKFTAIFSIPHDEKRCLRLLTTELHNLKAAIPKFVIQIRDNFIEN